MNLAEIREEQWPQVKEIYLEAFPKQERKPYGSLRRSVKRAKPC